MKNNSIKGTLLPMNHHIDGDYNHGLPHNNLNYQCKPPSIVGNSTLCNNQSKIHPVCMDVSKR